MKKVKSEDLEFKTDKEVLKWLFENVEILTIHLPLTEVRRMIRDGRVEDNAASWIWAKNYDIWSDWLKKKYEEEEG